MRHVRLAGGSALLAIALTSAACSSDSSGTEKTAKPADDTATQQGACTSLVGPGGSLVDDALKAGAAVLTSKGAAQDVARASEVQNKIFTIVSEGPAMLQDPAGQLVDYLDDPAAYQTKSGVDPLVTDAVATIKKVCAS